MGQALLRLEGRVGKGRQYLLFGKDKEKPSTLAGLFLGLSLVLVALQSFWQLACAIEVDQADQIEHAGSR